ncbi:competence protein ComEA [Alteribacillus persepolensis]|uniref:Competence protein ComEA n=1 Tax=Alteribacillus persepolensis TaxID=568899 RepID=A0A1G8CPU4_9BACI|nr:helix-hairpin-helix domain-containing protein [Alteribacillus persepolensis]SDH46890.1 competence protein ComEA [Alteribacillus persepolensis]
MFSKHPLFLSLGGIVLVFSVIFIVFYAKHNQTDSIQTGDLLEDEFFQEHAEEYSEVSTEHSEQEEAEMKLLVDVKGAVKHPGVYELEADNRVMDAVDAAGGLMDNSDEAQVNFAERIYDEMVIYVPVKGENPTPAAISAAPDDDKLRLNSAGAADLEQLPGIGPKKAEAIISYREEHGDFQQVEDLLHVSGIGEKSLEQLKEEVRVD